MRKVNSIYNQLSNKKKAFTLIELLIVIAIIGILFIVLVSKVDFATDKAKATGVQTDFRSFQLAFDTVAKENAGFNTFGFDTGDNGGGVAAGSSITINGKAYTYTNADKDKGDGIRNSYDEGDTNLDGKNVGETWTGRKVYTETWSDIWTLVKPGTSGYNSDAIFALESAINKNLDPKLHITIAADGKITMANQARDPWKNEYHGYYITNAETDKGDRGAIVMYSNGANGKWGSAHIIENGVVTVGVPGNNVDGKDDYSFVSCYTFTNGYGEVLNMSTGFSNNQAFKGSTSNTPSVVPGGNGGNAGGTGTNNNGNQMAAGATFNMKVSDDCTCRDNYPDETWHTCLIETPPVTLSWDELKLTENGAKYGYNASLITDNRIGDLAFYYCFSLTHITIPDTVTSIGSGAFAWTSLKQVDLSQNITAIPEGAFTYSAIQSINLPKNITSIGEKAFFACEDLETVTFDNTVQKFKALQFGNSWYGWTDIRDWTAIPADYITCTDGRFDLYVNGFDFKLNNDGTYKVSGLWYSSSRTELVVPSTVNGIPVTSISCELDFANATSITIPSTITYIDLHSFIGCDELESIIFEGTIEQWRSIEFRDYTYGSIPAANVQCTNGQATLGNTNTNVAEIVVTDMEYNGPYNIRYYIYENGTLVEKNVSVECGGSITINVSVNTEMYINTSNSIGLYDGDYNVDATLGDYAYDINMVSIMIYSSELSYIDIYT